MSSPTTFYPQLFRKTRPYLKGFMEDLQRLIDNDTANPTTCYTASARRILTALKESGINPSDIAFNTHGFTIENQAALMYGEWAQKGASLYTFKAPLVEALLATGVGEVALADLHFPFDCAYFDFGPQDDLILQSGRPVTGAYLLRTVGQGIRVALTAPLSGESPWTERWREVYDLRITEEHFNKNIENAIAAALADDVEDLRQAALTLRNSATPGIPSQSKQTATEAFLAAHEANQEAFTKCLQLIANAICYVTAFPDDSVEDWQPGTPEKMSMKADSSPPKEAARAASKLNAMGYRKVRFIGGEFSAAAQHTESGHVSPHWRRGHWRSQAHGPQMSQRKLIWLRPTRVMGGAASEEPRVYKTERVVPRKT